MSRRRGVSFGFSGRVYFERRSQITGYQRCTLFCLHFGFFWALCGEEHWESHCIVSLSDGKGIRRNETNREICRVQAWTKTGEQSRAQEMPCIVYFGEASAGTSMVSTGMDRSCMASSRGNVVDMRNMRVNTKIWGLIRAEDLQDAWRSSSSQ